MSIDLPPPVAAYLAAANARDADRAANCFTEHGVVRDEAKTINGGAAIRAWLVETASKYNHTFEPLACSQDGSVTVVRNRLTGSFPGSPIELQFRFHLANATIAE